MLERLCHRKVKQDHKLTIRSCPGLVSSTRRVMISLQYDSLVGPDCPVLATSTWHIMHHPTSNSNQVKIRSVAQTKPSSFLARTLFIYYKIASYNPTLNSQYG